MTPKEVQQWNKMLSALIKIHKHYQSPKQLQKTSEDQYGLPYAEALEMAYENVKQEAKFAAKNIRFKQPE